MKVHSSKANIIIHRFIYCRPQGKVIFSEVPVCPLGGLCPEGLCPGVLIGVQTNVKLNILSTTLAKLTKSRRHQSRTQEVPGSILNGCNFLLS